MVNILSWYANMCAMIILPRHSRFCFHDYNSLVFDSISIYQKIIFKMSVNNKVDVNTKLNANDLLDLNKTLQNNVDQDKIYWLRNDAKMRAVYSSQNYDEFR